MTYRVAIVAVLALTTCGFVAQSDQPVKGPLQITSATVSAVVAATWGTDVDASGGDRLAFLVLSRGTVGWVFRAGPFQTRGGGGQVRSDGLIGPAVLIQEVSLGAVQYRIKFDRLAKQITIGSQTITVESPAGIPGTSGINTVFVDGVDSSEGPHIVRTLWVDPQISSPHTVGIIALIRRTPELREFVRCDLKVDNSQQQSVIDYLCKGL